MPVRLLAALLLSLFLFGGCASTAPPPVSSPSTSPPPTDPPAEPVVSETERPQRPLPGVVTPPPEFRRAIEMGTRTPTGEPGPRYWQQESDYVIEARIDPDAKRLEGSARITYTNNSPYTLPTLVLALLQNMHAPGAIRFEEAEVTGGVEIRSVRIDGQPVAEATGDGLGPLNWTVQHTNLVVVPAQPMQPNTSVTLEIDYAFTIPQAGASGRMGHQGGNLLYLAYWYPQMLVLDDVTGWQADPFVAISEFYAGFGSYDVTIDAPAGWLAMATGTLQNPDEVLADDVRERLEEAESSDAVVAVVPEGGAGTATRAGTDGRLRWHFRADRVRDFAFSLTSESRWDAARAPVGDRDGDGTPEYTRVDALYRDSAPRWTRVAEYEQHAITALSEYTGLPYPYPHMSAVEAGGIIGGGMEYPMMTMMGHYNTSGDTALYNVTAHELAHMWLPMIVSNDERRYAWMDEGMITFLENTVRMVRHPGLNHYLPDLNRYLAMARQETEGEIMRRSSFHYDSGAYWTATYGKPGSLLYALRGLLGEETFDRALRAFMDRWAFKHPYPWDLWNTFEDVSGEDLDWFWRSWYEETWTLDHAIADVTETDDGLAVTISDQGYGFMPVRLAVTRADGTVERLEIPVDVWLTGRTSTTITLPQGADVERIEIDPEVYFPDIDRSDNVWTP